MLEFATAWDAQWLSCDWGGLFAPNHDGGSSAFIQPWILGRRNYGFARIVSDFPNGKIFWLGPPQTADDDAQAPEQTPRRYTRHRRLPDVTEIVEFNLNANNDSANLSEAQLFLIYGNHVVAIADEARNCGHAFCRNVYSCNEVFTSQIFKRYWMCFNNIILTYAMVAGIMFIFDWTVLTTTLSVISLIPFLWLPSLYRASATPYLLPRSSRRLGICERSTSKMHPSATNGR
ncbi:hypothetical protein V8C37DRAFT_365662 [Trichoderma ceciliae]